MDYKSKYLKYKNKYKQLLKLYGGTIERSQSQITEGYTNVSNKGTQNCGVFIKYKQPDRILLCNNSKLDDEQLEFLNINNNSNLKIYPRFYQLYHSIDTDKYFYEWERMDGDLRDFFFKHIPTKVLEKLEFEEDAIKLFIKLIDCKSYQTKLYNKKIYDDNEYELIGEYIGVNLVYKKEDEEYIKHKLNIIKQCDITFGTLKYAEIMQMILSEIEKQLEKIIKSISYKRFLMAKLGFKTSDKKFDNIVYKIIKNNDDYDYEFYFIDPESTLVKSYWEKNDLENIKQDIKTKYNTFKVTDAIPNIYETFLTNMFNIYDYEHNDLNTYNHVYLNYLDKEIKEGRYPQEKRFINAWYFAIEKYNVNINNIFPLEFKTDEDLLDFLEKK